MSETIDELLAKCLERMEAGASLESCLADYPRQAAELEPLLRMTQEMKYLAKVGPRPAFAQDARLKLENQLATSGKVVTFGRQNRRTKQEPKLLLQRRFSMSVLQLILGAILALTATTGGVAYAANASNPGDLLHGLDLAMENAQLNLAPDVSSKVQLRLEFANERLTEAQATFSKNDMADGLEAMNEYGTEISAAAQLVGSENGADQEALAALLETAHAVHQNVLTNLLDKVPDQAKDAIQNALDASSKTGKPNEVGNPNSSGQPDGVSNPNGTDHSNGAGNSNKPDGTGNPNGVGGPNGTGNPNGNSNGVSAPGADISACANSLSQENAHALADLAKKHGVDYQYVLENFCVAGTLDKVEEMLSGLQGPPNDVPAGPPTDTPGGPPSNTPGGRPTNPPGKP
ncbi:MAG TPA: DUF5667 domain-containing protein [Anaerolineales bacterium]|nr:DUF5667 domain-containing protein [Anaerolineales bacterium]